MFTCQVSIATSACLWHPCHPSYHRCSSTLPKPTEIVSVRDGFHGEVIRHGKGRLGTRAPLHGIGSGVNGSSGSTARSGADGARSLSSAPNGFYVGRGQRMSENWVSPVETRRLRLSLFKTRKRKQRRFIGSIHMAGAGSL